jgi:ABC-type arginine transport system permease subunit
VASLVASITGVIANGMGGNHAGVAVGLTTWNVTFAVHFRKMMRAALLESWVYREGAHR